MHVHGVPLRVFFVMVGSCLKVSSFGVSSLKDTSWAMSARVYTLNVPDRLMTIGMILSFIFPF